MTKYRQRTTGLIHTESEIRKLNEGSSIPSPLPADSLGYDVIFPTPKPAPSTAVKVVYLDGCEQDANSNWVEKWSERDMFQDTEEYTQEEQETAYLAKLESDEIARQSEELSKAVQVMLDDSAKTRRYDDIVSECSYATSTGTFGAEAQITVEWRDEVWTYVAQVESDVMAGLRTMPTTDELLNELPTRPTS